MSGGDRLGEQAGKCSNVLRRRVRQHTMPKIEHVRSPAEGAAKLSHSLFQSGPPEMQQNRVEISLNWNEPLKSVAGIARRHRRIQPNPVDPALGDITFIEKTCGSRKADDGAIRKPTLQRCDDLPRRLDNPSPKLFFRQNARPAVEELHELCARLDLAGKMFDCALDEHVDQRAKVLRVAIGPALDPPKILA